MEPLRDIAADGYPTDYVVARVRSRRAALLAAGRRGRPPGLEDAASDEAIWDDLLTEFDWLRRQMNPRLRAIFGPVFTLFGIKTLVLALRNKAAERHAAVGRLMQHELFADELRDALVRAPDVGSAVAAVIDAFAPALGDARGLAAAYADGGLKGLETRLTRDFLGRVASMRSPEAIQSFFAAFIDLRNVMTLYKHLRWGFQDAAAFVAGGTLGIARLSAASASGDSRCLDDLVGEIAGGAAPAVVASEVALETRLLSHLTRLLRKRGRQGDDVDRIMDYAWSLYVHARNRALRLHAGSMETGSLERELIA
jgi:hypothetical protein